MELDNVIEKFKNLNSDYSSERLRGLTYASYNTPEERVAEEKSTEDVTSNIKNSSDIYSEFFKTDLIKKLLSGEDISEETDKFTEEEYPTVGYYNDVEIPDTDKNLDLKDDDPKKDDKVNSKKINFAKNNNFEKLLDDVSLKDPRVNHYRKFLTLLAAKESGYKPGVSAVTNKHHGFFQINEGSIKELSPGNLSVKDFKNNPEAQIITAMNLADSFKKGWTQADILKGRELGYDEFSMLSGSWLGGNGNLRKFIHQGINADDSHHYTTDGSKDSTKGVSMKDRMNLFKANLR